MTITPYPVATAPRVMDVLWCYFPYDEAPDVPGPTPHPALVFAVREPRAGLVSVRVAFGSSNIARADRFTNFVVSPYGEQQVAGLNKETMFDLGRCRWLEWAPEWFHTPDPKRWSTPKIGCIEADGQQALRAVISIRRQWAMPCPSDG